MDLTQWRQKMIRLGLIFTLILSSGFLVACAGEGGTEKPQIGAAGAPEQPDTVKEKTWNKMNWNSGKWG